MTIKKLVHEIGDDDAKKKLKRQHNGFKGSDADGDIVFWKRLMLKKNQYSKDYRT